MNLRESLFLIAACALVFVSGCSRQELVFEAVNKSNFSLANVDVAICGKGVEDGDEAETRKEVLDNLEKLSQRGVAYLTLAHFYPNRCAYPVFPYPEYGIKRSNWKQLMAD